MQLCEQHRPTSRSEGLGQDKILAKLVRLRKRSLTGRAYFLSGPSRCGKTTIARLIAAASRMIASTALQSSSESAGQAETTMAKSGGNTPVSSPTVPESVPTRLTD